MEMEREDLYKLIAVGAIILALLYYGYNAMTTVYVTKNIVEYKTVTVNERTVTVNATTCTTQFTSLINTITCVTYEDWEPEEFNETSP